MLLVAPCPLPEPEDSEPQLENPLTSLPSEDTAEGNTKM